MPLHKGKYEIKESLGNRSIFAFNRDDSGNFASASRKHYLDGIAKRRAGHCEKNRKTSFRRLFRRLVRPVQRNEANDFQVIAESRKWIMVHIDGDKQEKVAGKYKVEAYPTLLIISPKGKVVASEVGGQKAGELLKWMKSKYSAARK